MAKKGKFIVIDGGEGSGKTTRIGWLAESFASENVILTREPGGSLLAEEVRKLMLNETFSKNLSPESQFALVWAARHDHICNKIKPALESGRNVITDRFDSSTYAYQIFGQERDELKDLFWKMREIYLSDCFPDMYIFLDIKPEDALARISDRGEKANHFDERDLEFHNRIREGYMEFLSKVPHVIVNTDKDIEAGKNEFINHIKSIIKLP